MNISVTEEMHRFILTRVRAGGHSTVSEYIRSLVRRDGLGTAVTAPTKYEPPRRANEYLSDPDAEDE